MFLSPKCGGEKEARRRRVTGGRAEGVPCGGDMQR
jgi:hypothetical protein